MAAMKRSVISMTRRFDLRPNGREAHISGAIAGPCRKYLDGWSVYTAWWIVPVCAVTRQVSGLNVRYITARSATKSAGLTIRARHRCCERSFTEKFRSQLSIMMHTLIDFGCFAQR